MAAGAPADDALKKWARADHRCDPSRRMPRPLKTHSARIGAMRSAAWPSHRGGLVGRAGGEARMVKAASRTASGLLPTRRFVPRRTVTGRSVLSRIVKQG